MKMGMIKGWKKGKPRGNTISWKNVHSRNRLDKIVVVGRLITGWQLMIWRHGKVWRKNEYETKKDALWAAIRYMKVHPRG